MSGILEIPSSVELISNSAFFGCSGFKEIHFISTNVTVEPFSFSRLSNRCYENVPESFHINDPEIYSSTNFNGKMISGEVFNLKFHCSVFYNLDMFLYVLTIIGSSGAFVAIFTFGFNTFQLFYKNVHQLETIFDAIIAKEKTQNENESFNEQRSVENITNCINNYLLIDSKEKDDFTFTERQMNKALQKSIETQWPNLHIVSKKYILNHSFNDISYHKSCLCSCTEFISSHLLCCFHKCNCKCKKHNEESSDSEEHVSHKSLALQELI